MFIDKATGEQAKQLDSDCALVPPQYLPAGQSSGTLVPASQKRPGGQTPPQDWATGSGC
jgi:hypothetical protein